MLFNSVSDAVVMADIETLRLIDVNETAEKLYGYSYGEMLQLTATDLSAEPEKTLEAFQNETTLVPIRKHRKKNGVVFDVEIKTKIFDYNNSRIHLSTIRDISERTVVINKEA